MRRLRFCTEMKGSVHADAEPERLERFYFSIGRGIMVG